MERRNLDTLINSVPFSIHGYDFQRLLKVGRSSCIFRATQESSGRVFSIKVFHCLFPKDKDGKTYNMSACTYADLPHPNIITLFEKFVENDFLFLVLDYCGKGSVEDYVRNNYKFTEVQIRKAMKQILTAIEYCHSQGVSHKNINPESILISDDGIIKLADFDVGVTMLEEREVKHAVPPLNFVPPEVLLNKEYDPCKADIWSLGVVFYYLVSRKLPWGENEEEIKRNIISGKFEFPSDMPLHSLNLIKKMIILNPDERAKATDLLNDSCFEEFKATCPQAINAFNGLNIPICKNVHKGLLHRKHSLLSKKIISPVPTPSRKPYYSDIHKSQEINSKRTCYVL